MFALEQYVPVLRWKRGEQVALVGLDTADRDAITPLIEIPPDDYLPDNPEAATNLARRLPRLSAALETARGSRRTFVDFGLLSDGVKTPAGREPIIEFFAPLPLSLEVANLRSGSPWLIFANQICIVRSLHYWAATASHPNKSTARRHGIRGKFSAKLPVRVRKGARADAVADIHPYSGFVPNESQPSIRRHAPDPPT